MIMPSDEIANPLGQKSTTGSNNEGGGDGGSLLSKFTSISDFSGLESHDLAAWRQTIRLTLQHAITSFLSGFFTLMALFLPDYHKAHMSTSTDTFVEVLLTLTVLFFLLEMMGTLVANRGAVWSLFFWLDFFATVSLIPDIPWMAEIFDPSGWQAFQTGVCEFAEGAKVFDEATNNAGSAMMRAGRAARAGARAGRLQGLVRVARMLRLMRVGRLVEKTGLKQKEIRQAEQQDEQEVIVPDIIAEGVSHSLSRVMIVLVIVCVITTSLLEYQSRAAAWQHQTVDILESSYVSGNRAAVTNQQTCNASGGNATISVDCYSEVLSHITNVPVTETPEEQIQFVRDFGFGAAELFYVEVCDPYCNVGTSTTGVVKGTVLIPRVPLQSDGDVITGVMERHSELRDDDIVDIYICTGRNGEYAGRAIYSGKYDVQQAAISRLYLTLLVVCVLIVFGFVTSTEMNSFVSLPMQRLIKSQALSEALLTIFMAQEDPIPTLEKSSRQILNCEVVNIYFKEDDVLWCARSLSDPTPYTDEVRVNVGHGVVGECAVTQEIVRKRFRTFIEVPKNDPSLRSLVPQRGRRGAYEWVSATVLCYPLLFRVGNTKEVVGVMQAINKSREKKPTIGLVDNFLQLVGISRDHSDDDFSEFDEEMIKMFADQVSNVLKQFQMDAVYDHVFQDDSSSPDMSNVKGLLADFATADAVTLSKERIEKSKSGNNHLREIFKMYDLDGNGTLDRDEIIELAKSLGKDYTPEQMDSIMVRMNEYDAGTSDDEVSFEEFEAWWNKDEATDLKEAARSQAADLLASQVIQVDRVLQGVSLPTIQELRKWGFGCLDLTQEQLVGASLRMFTDPELGFKAEYFDINVDTINNFCAASYGRYNEVPYHNMYHAFSVLQGCYVLATSTALGKQFTNLEQFAMLVASVGHDMGHVGLNTQFLVTFESELAMMYNDKSPLENMHSRETFQVMQMSGCDVLSMLGDDKRNCRRIIIDAIIGTDMAFHKKHVDHLSAKHTVSMDLASDREMMLGMLVHLCDIGASSFAWDEAVRWSRMVMTEFQTQVFREESNGLPVSGYMDLGTGNPRKAFLKSQLGFIDFVLTPYFQLFPPHMPETKEYLDQLQLNKHTFDKIEKGEMELTKALPADDRILRWSINVGATVVPAAQLAASEPTLVLASTGAVDRTS